MESPRRILPAWNHWWLRTALLLLIGATVLGILSAGANVHNVDVEVSQGIQRWQGTLPERLQHFGDMSADTIAGKTGMVLLLAITLVAKRRPEAMFVLLVSLLRILALLLKLVFESPRPTPDHVEILREYESTGYPSGHSIMAAVLAGTAVVLVYRMSRTDPIRWIALILGIAFTVFVGWSRIWAGAHWPTDVLGGWSYGVGFVLISAWFVFVYWPARKTRATEANSTDSVDSSPR